MQILVLEIMGINGSLPVQCTLTRNSTAKIRRKLLLAIKPFLIALQGI